MTSRKRSKIKSAAQKVKSKYQIGSSLLHDNNYEMFKKAFNNDEIVKIKVNREDSNDKSIVREMAVEISKKINVELIDVIGTTIILYKENKDEEKRVNYDI